MKQNRRMEGPLRIDKWLWAARFFKTRVLATAACDAGHIACNGQNAKPSRVLKAGDRLHIRADSGEYDVEVLLLSDQRGSAAVAQEMYREPDESRELRARAAEARRTMFLAEPNFARRPNKKERRLIHKFSGRD